MAVTTMTESSWSAMLPLFFFSIAFTRSLFGKRAALMGFGAWWWDQRLGSPISLSPRWLEAYLKVNALWLPSEVSAQCSAGIDDEMTRLRASLTVRPLHHVRSRRSRS